MSHHPPAARVGDFQITDFVGAGGMGVVYRAIHVHKRHVVAIKFLRGDAAHNLKSRERFAQEARVQSSLQHPNLAAFYEWHEIQGVPCIVMEWVEGQTISERIRANGALEIEEATAIFAQIVEAIGWMHERGVIHRDIKSGNIVINARGEVKLLDFGIAKTHGAPKLTATGAFVGTLQYLSPEQIKGAPADARCDIWALGVLFYEMLCGQVPFDAPTLGELLEKVSHAQYAPLRQTRPEIPRAAEVIVRRCLQKSPAARFQNATQLSNALQKLRPQTGTSPGFGAIPVRVWAGAGVIVLLMALALLGNALRTPQTIPQPTPTALSLTGNVVVPQTIKPTPREPQTASTNQKTPTKIVTIDVFGGAEQTEIWRDDILLGHPPLPITARVGETLDLTLKRPGYRSRRETITVTDSSALYSFNLEKS